jgi:hypothetical protein
LQNKSTISFASFTKMVVSPVYDECRLPQMYFLMALWTLGDSNSHPVFIQSLPSPSATHTPSASCVFLDIDGGNWLDKFILNKGNICDSNSKRNPCYSPGKWRSCQSTSQEWKPKPRLPFCTALFLVSRHCNGYKVHRLR